MNQSSMQIDKRHVGEPVTRSAQENVDAGYFAKPEFNAVSLNAKKLQSNWAITTETLQNNIEQDDFEQTLMEDFTQRIAKDLELLAINGDTSLSSGTPQGALLNTLDGWAKQAENAHTLNARGNTISDNIFARARQQLPKNYRNDGNLMWIVSDAIATDWLDELRDNRQTAVGDRAISGESVSPLGIPMMTVSSIPDNQDVSSPNATPGVVLGDRQGPFRITSSQDTIHLEVVDASDTSVFDSDITFTNGTQETAVIANEIEDAVNTGGDTHVIVDDDGEGRVEISTAETGDNTEVIVTAPGSNSALDVLGFSDGQNGTGADSGGTVPRGSFMFLTNPENLIWGILEGTRVMSEFDKDFDRVETVVYNQVDAAIENPDALVKVKNIRTKNYV
jgi:hypothetical protein